MSVRFAERLKEMRLENKLTQQTLADTIGINRSTISFYESATNDPTENIIVKLSEIFNVSTDYILGLVPYENEEPKIK